VYRRLDAAVGELSSLGTIVCICSDHGFGGAGTQALYLNRFLEDRGWLKFREARGQGLEPLRQLALRLPLERILRRLPPQLLGRAESAARFGEIDFAHTRAWSDELNYAATIHLNLKGREAQGILPDRGAAIRELSSLLLDWRVEGRQVIQKVIPREQAMSGPATEGAPDLYLDLALEEGFSATLLPSGRVPRGTLSRRLAPEEWVGGKGLGMNGSHRPEGVFLLHGPGVRPGRVEANVADVMPTLLSLTRQPIPLHCDGKVLHHALLDPEEHREALSFIPPTPRLFTDREDNAIRKKLERLGYL
jgi:predicted AlkP superfamily phosphohydrolase/phosphomutase